MSSFHTTLFSLFLRAIVLFGLTIAGDTKCGNPRDAQITINLIGEPVCKINITWTSLCNQTLERIYYYKLSSHKVCNSKILNTNQLGDPHCTTRSYKPGDIHHCILGNKSLYDLGIKFARQETICIVKETRLQNKTWYTFNECSGFVDSYDSHCLNTCPAPDNVHIEASLRRTLNVIYDAPKCITGKYAILDIGFKIAYRPVKTSTSEDLQTITHEITDVMKGFAVKDNLYNIENLYPGTLYQVHMCCFFKTNPGRCPMSKKYFARTLEEAPSKPPIVTTALLEKGTLKIKFKLPLRNTRNGRLVMYELNIWRSTINCSIVYKRTITKISNISAEDIKRGDINVTVPLPYGKTFCCRVKVSTASGWSPWSRVHPMQDVQKNVVARKAQTFKSENIIAIAVGVASVVVVTIIITILYKTRRMTSNTREELPTEIAPGQSTSTMYIEEPTDNEYASVEGNDQIQLLTN